MKKQGILLNLLNILDRLKILHFVQDDIKCVWDDIKCVWDDIKCVQDEG